MGCEFTILVFPRSGSLGGGGDGGASSFGKCFLELVEDAVVWRWLFRSLILDHGSTFDHGIVVAFLLELCL